MELKKQLSEQYLQEIETTKATLNEQLNTAKTHNRKALVGNKV